MQLVLLSVGNDADVRFIAIGRNTVVQDTGIMKSGMWKTGAIPMRRMIIF